MKLDVIAASPYEKVKNLCHKVKEYDPTSIAEAVTMLVPLLPCKSIIIPIPGHTKESIYTSVLGFGLGVAAVQKGKEALVSFNLLSSTPHPSLCFLKQENKPIENVKIEMQITKERRNYLKYMESQGYEIILLDNVIDTGKTAKACIKAIGKDVKLLVIGDTQNWKNQAT